MEGGVSDGGRVGWNLGKELGQLGRNKYNLLAVIYLLTCTFTSSPWGRAAVLGQMLPIYWNSKGLNPLQRCGTGCVDLAEVCVAVDGPVVSKRRP